MQTDRRRIAALLITRTAYAVSVLTRCCVSVRPSVRLSVCLSQGQRTRQQQSRAAAGDAHRRLHVGRVDFVPTEGGPT